MSANKVFYCTLCEKTWEDQLPEGAVHLTAPKRGGNGHAATYRFADGSIHVIKKQTAKNAGEKK
jgi:hypothetical protein